MAGIGVGEQWISNRFTCELCLHVIIAFMSSLRTCELCFHVIIADMWVLLTCERCLHVSYMNITCTKNVQ